MVATGIVTMTEDGKYSLPHDKSVINMWGHASTLFPIFCELFPKLEEATSQDGPSGNILFTAFLFKVYTFILKYLFYLCIWKHVRYILSFIPFEFSCISNKWIVYLNMHKK